MNGSVLAMYNSNEEYLSSQSADLIPSNTIDIYPLRANLYPLSLSPRPRFVYEWSHEVDGMTHEEVSLESVINAIKTPATVWKISRALKRMILTGFKSEGYRVSRKSPKIIKVDRNYAPSGSALQIYPSFELRILCFNDNYYLGV